eukprot:gene42358-biopygen31558
MVTPLKGPNPKSTKTVKAALQSQIASYASENYQVTEVLTDKEGGVLSCKSDLEITFPGLKITA